MEAPESPGRDSSHLALAAAKHGPCTDSSTRNGKPALMTTPAMLRIHTDGTVDRVQLLSTDRVRHLLNVEMVDIIRCGSYDIWMDDEGLLNGQPPNIVASLLLVALDVGNGQPTQMLHGPVLLASVDEDGNTVALSESDDQMLTLKIRAIHHYAIDHGLLG